MAGVKNWTPIRWQCGPLDALVAERSGTDPWLDPRRLELLRGSAFDAIVVAWAAGGAEDANQQKALIPLLHAAAEAGVGVLGTVEAGTDLAVESVRAKRAGIAELIGAPVSAHTDVPVFPRVTRQALLRGPELPRAVIADNLWPGNPVKSITAAGPTASPWINSNAWFTQLARTRRPNTEVWLSYAPPKGAVITAEAYRRAMADAAVRGAKWVVSLDPVLRQGLAAGETGALAVWKSIRETAAFFRSHQEWSACAGLGDSGVITGGGKKDELIEHEVLNLLARRNLPYRVLIQEDAANAAMDDFQGIVCLPTQPPVEALRAKLSRFVEGGGVLLTRGEWARMGVPVPEDGHPRMMVRAHGKGRTGVYKTEAIDPFLVARDFHQLRGRVRDMLRFFNISSMTTAYLASPGGRRHFLHIINHTMRVPGDLVTVWFRQRYRAARAWVPGQLAAIPAELVPEQGGVEVRLPSISDYLAVELEI